jgi:hypothetical protein
VGASVLIAAVGVVSLLLLQIGPFARPSVRADGIPQRGEVSLADASSHEEAHLYYPGAKEFSRLGADESSGSSAFSGAILTSSDPPERILGWYAAWAPPHGWSHNDVLSGGPAIQDQGWKRGTREYFLISIDDPQQLANSLGRRVPVNATVFEITYTIAHAN